MPYTFYGILAKISSRNMATVTQRFGAKVREVRKKKGMSQQDLAGKAKLDLTTINELEVGNREPMLKTVWKIANALGVRMSQLVDF
jgi:transcriptional regulator with XRE-family HTH domain